LGKEKGCHICERVRRKKSEEEEKYSDDPRKEAPTLALVKAITEGERKRRPGMLCYEGEKVRSSTRP